MRYATADRFRAALEDRLRACARAGRLPVARLRKEVVFDRLLAPLLVVAPDRWILKGGLALDYRLGDRARTTKDMDLGRQDTAEASTRDLMAAARLDLGDYLLYTIEHTDALAALEEGAAIRYRVHADLAGRLFERAVIDVGFDAPFILPVERVRGPDLLTFADLDPVEVPAIPLAYHMAEKVHAYSRQYGPGGRASTRVKDIVDLALIAATSALDYGAVRDALEWTFARRATHALPLSLPAPPAAWAATYKTIAGEIGLETDMSAGHSLAALCLDPVLSGAGDRAATWQPAIRAWWTPT